MQHNYYNTANTTQHYNIGTTQVLQNRYNTSRQHKYYNAGNATQLLQHSKYNTTLQHRYNTSATKHAQHK